VERGGALIACNEGEAYIGNGSSSDVQSQTEHPRSNKHITEDKRRLTTDNKQQTPENTSGTEED
jgi:hypothetical protein